MPCKLSGWMRGANPDADVDVCLSVYDEHGDLVLFTEAPLAFAEPYPGDDGRYLVHATIDLAGLAAQASCTPVLRELAAAIEREADRIDEEERRRYDDPQIAGDEDGNLCVL